MVERVARSLSPHAFSEASEGALWGPRARQDAMDKARAAIEAMREPTEAMMAAGDSLAVPDEGYYPGAGPVWVIMNEAALNPASSPSDTNQQPSP